MSTNRPVGASPRQFSLQEEARNTERHRSWNSDLKLRHAQVKFVSATGTESKEPTDIEESMHRASFSSTDMPKKATAEDLPNPHTSGLILNNPISLAIPVRPVDRSSPPVNCVDGVAKDGKTGIQNANEMGEIDGLFPHVVQTGLPSPLIQRSISPAGSNSSEEVIIFSGRARSRQRRPEVPFNPAGFNPLASRTSDINPSFHSRSTQLGTSIFNSHPRTSNPPETRIPKPPPRLKKRSKGMRDTQDEKEVLADYITNIQTGGQTEELIASHSLTRRELGGSDNNVWEDEADISSMDIEFERLLDNDTEADWSEGDLNDFDELSTSNEILGEVSHVLSKRERPSGLQYLIVCEGYTFDEARWIPLSSLNTPRAQDLINQFDKSREIAKLSPLSSRGTDVASNLGDLAALDLEEALDDLRDEEDLLKRKQDRMTDEQIARLLSKQEELGLGSDELVLFDGDESSGTSDVDNLDILRKDAMRFSIKGGRRMGRHQDAFDHAGAFANALNQDPYGDFDIMDQNRPSLRRKSKGYRGMQPFELSDTELANTMNLNWEKDREKKKMRKIAREELRTQGLLTKKENVDMKAKYPEGMSYGDIKSEVRSFMLSTSER